MTDRAAWLIYGTNGYTGRLVAVEARRRGLRPVLAGRRADPIVSRVGFSFLIGCVPC
jgi:short subunit dehydrogenase-like uncharacterized protein